MAQHVKRSPRLQHIPVLLLAGAFEPVDQAKATAVGCNGVLAKPFEPQLVIARVKELLGVGIPPADAVAASPPLRTPASDMWAAAPAEPAAGSPGPAEVAQLDDYFAQLDAAFATREGAPGEQAGLNSPISALEDGMDWFKTTLDPPPAQPLSQREPVRQTEPLPPPPAVAQLPQPVALSPAPVAESPEPVAPSWVAPPPVPVAPPRPVREVPAEAGVLPSLTDAFAAILAAEQHEPMPARLHWPAASAGAFRQWRAVARRRRHRRNHTACPRAPVRSDRPRDGRGPRVEHRRATRTRRDRAHQINDQIAGK